MVHKSAQSLADRVGKTHFCDSFYPSSPRTVSLLFDMTTVGYVNQNAHDDAGVPKRDPAMWGLFVHQDDRLQPRTHWTLCEEKGEL